MQGNAVAVSIGRLEMPEVVMGEQRRLKVVSQLAKKAMIRTCSFMKNRVIITLNFFKKSKINICHKIKTEQNVFNKMSK